MKVKLLVALFCLWSILLFPNCKRKSGFNNYDSNVEIVNRHQSLLQPQIQIFLYYAKPNDILVFVAKGYEIKKSNHHFKMITENNLEITWY
jgi:hypothetical protein